MKMFWIRFFFCFVVFQTAHAIQMLDFLLRFQGRASIQHGIQPWGRRSLQGLVREVGSRSVELNPLWCCRNLEGLPEGIWA